MSWPLSQDYNEAIQSPASNFADPDLRTGKAATNAFGVPMPCSGNFADVYQVRCPDGSRWAVKCFTREVAGLQQRYEAISRHLRQARLPFTVDFSYLEQGIRVGGRWFPVLKMQWVEGLMLNQFVAKYADKPAVLEGLLQVWTRMARHLRASGTAHCDLQHGNVLLVPDSGSTSLALKLVDYDGMWVPALAGQKSGEVGHASYQHPLRAREGTFSLEVDRFPVLLIATALIALKAGGRPLWEKYDNGDNLLFTEADLLAPAKSRLFFDLIRSDDSTTAAMANALVDALRRGVESAPLLEELMAEARPAPAPPPARGLLEPAPAPRRKLPTDAEAEPESADGSSAIPVSDGGQTRTGVPLAAWVGGIVVIVVLLVAVGAIILTGRSGPETPVTGPALAKNRPVAEKGPAKPVVDPRPATGTSNPTSTGKPGPVPEPPPPDPPGETKLAKSVSNSLDMKLMLIPPGKFTMGSPKEEVGRQEREGPQHAVEITRPFYMATCPVTRGQFAAFADSEDYKSEAESDGRGGEGYNAATRRWEERGPKYTWKNPGFVQTAAHPVVNVTWNDAAKFCEWLGKKEGKPYELPTEAEWEWACRAGTRTRFWFGDKDADLNGRANIADVSLKARLDSRFVKNVIFQGWDDGHPFTSPVGIFKANSWGLYDMHGNVWQWCGDQFRQYQSGYYKDLRGAGNARSYAVRGGSWGNDPNGCRCAVRTPLDPGYRSFAVGFRVVWHPDVNAR